MYCTSTLAQQATEFNVNGLRVIFKQSPKQVVSAIMYFKGGTGNYDSSQQGIEDLTLSATAECGTEKYNKNAFKDLADKYGVSVYGYSSYDYGAISLSCVKPYLDEGWDLFTQAITNPIFNATELALLQQKKAAEIQNQSADPDSKLSKMTMQTSFKGTRYAYEPQGTVAGITSFKPEQLKNYYQKIYNADRMLLVIVGNFSEEKIKELVQNSFAKLPHSSINSLPSPTDLKIADPNTIDTVSRKLATNYIQGVLGAPSAASKDMIAYRIAVNTFSNKLFEEVRTKRNLSYAPYAYVSTGFIPYTIMYVTTTKPKEAVTVMTDELNKLRNNGFTEQQLHDSKAGLTTSFFMRNESTGSVASAYGIAALRGDWHSQERLVDDINSVTLSQLQKVFNEYTAGGIQWNYLGNVSLVDAEAFNIPVK